jgi:hypothetical protein
MVTVTTRAKEALARMVEHEGAKVLLIDDELTESLAGARIDGKTTGQGLQLVIAKAREE